MPAIKRDTRCPRCDNLYDGRFPALSRWDNATYICSECGTHEAMVNLAYPKDHMALHPVKGAFIWEVPPSLATAD